MEIKQNVNIHNRFDVHIDNIETGEHRELVGYNIILDQMWTRLCGGSSYFGYIHFGKGTGTPTPERTSLFNHLGTKSAVTEEIIKALPVSSWRRKIVLNPEEYVGETITEVGIARGSSASNLVTHAMLKDSEGNPISITKSDTDVVTIYATVFITFMNTPPTMKLLGVPNNNQLINYLTGSAAPSGSFRLLPGEHYGERLGSTSSATWVSDVPNRKRKTNVLRFGINDANGDVKSLEFTDLFALKFPTPGIFEGQSYTNVPIGVGDDETTEFILPSRNIIKSTLKVKKEGVITTDYTTSNISLFNFKIQDPSVLPPNFGNGVALTPDGAVMAVAHAGSPYVTTYDWDGEAWVKRPNPSVRPTNVSEGVALTHDGAVMAVAHQSSPYVTTYDWDGEAWVKRPDPSVLPPNFGNGVALTPDGAVMAVVHNTPPYVTTYDWDGTEWVKRPDPLVLPTDNANGVALTPDGAVMAVAHAGSPYITTYDWVEGEWVKRPNPSVRPTDNANGVALTPDGAVMAVAHQNSPYITTYDWVEGEWVKRPDPLVLPTGRGNGVALTPDGAVMAVAHGSSPYITTYDWVDGEWVKRPNPSVRPTNASNGVALTSDGTLMAVAHHGSPYITTYDCKPRNLKVTFDTPPASGDVITADYTVEGVHKTDQYVIDVSFAIQFGEGV
jgi:sugar lactone lactonase YvrE